MLYLTSTPKSIGTLLVQDVDGAERPVYYISQKIRGAEVRYTPIERHCLALVFPAQKLRHYFLAHHIQIVTRSDPIRYLLSKPALTGKVARWLLALGEFKITCVAPKAIKSQSLANLLAQFPSGDYEPVNEELRGEVHATMASEESFWTLSFDGAAARGKGEIGIVLTSKSGKKLYLSYKLDFHCSNNEAEYKALILGLIATEKYNIKKIRIRGDSKLIVKQVLGQFVLKEPALATYRTTVQMLLDRFQKVEIEHVPRSDSKFSDALATLGARVNIPEEEATIVIKKRTEPSIIPEDKDFPEDWRGEVLERLKSKVGKLTMAKLAQFIIIQGELYFRGGLISTPSKGYKWILAATELSTKWVEAIPLKNATGPAVANFIKENIICRFGVPNTILSDNGTPLINKYVKSLLETYQVKHHKSTPYYPKGNGQAEATNKTLIRILSKMMDEFGGT
ncbi:uncharacterized protein LOC114278525 [Camellia sinensis]|uniref:uncharacterized protein LOC114278525 n=1 Tax=Camellia sinensis TaxID=4442 RepID=UPI001035D661|nr:uncharacterized protein LOC114278525 [Camellia sinensis]